jgi:acyl-coenzyme A synthetase/AMP-(fatty) acid ligase
MRHITQEEGTGDWIILEGKPGAMEEVLRAKSESMARAAWDHDQEYMASIRLGEHVEQLGHYVAMSRVTVMILVSGILALLGAVIYSLFV